MSLDKSARVESDVRRIEGSDGLSERDKKLLLDFKRDLKLDEASDAHVHKLLCQLRIMGERLDARFGDASTDELKGLVEWVNGKDLSHSTKQNYRKSLKRFYRWLNDGEFPEEVRWINTTGKRKNDKLPRNLLTESDIKSLIDATENSRDPAFIALLWETGARIGEILYLKVGCFEEREHGKKVVIRGKTGPRRLPLISSLPDISNWLANHPRKESPKAPLWCKIHGDDAGERVSYEYMRKMLRRVADRAGVDKPVNPHHFRHSRATYLANHFTEAQLCQYFGWVQGSDRPADYVHLSGRDIDVQYDRLHGFEDGPSSEKSGLSPRECPRCGNLNDPNASFCQKCGQALSHEAFRKLEREEGFSDEVVEKIDEMGATGSLGELIDRAVEERVKEEMEKVREEMSREVGPT